MKNKGITLIALVITIIILLILAAITINLTLGENGIIRRAEEAGRNYTEAQNNELADLGEFENIIDNVIAGGTVEGNTTTPQDTPLATSIITSDNYGESVNYEAGGVSGWQVFLNDGGHIYIIASDYVSLSGKSLPNGINLDTNGYKVYGSNSGDNAITRDQFIDWLKNGDIWGGYANGTSGETTITGGAATGGPTLEQFVKSYNAANGSTYSSNEGQSGWTLSNTEDSMWLKTSQGRANGYWLTSPYSGFSVVVWGVEYSGKVNGYGYNNEKFFGVCPLVCLPSNIKMTWNGDTNKWDLNY